MKKYDGKKTYSKFCKKCKKLYITFYPQSIKCPDCQTGYRRSIKKVDNLNKKYNIY